MDAVERPGFRAGPRLRAATRPGRGARAGGHRDDQGRELSHTDRSDALPGLPPPLGRPTDRRPADPVTTKPTRSKVAFPRLSLRRRRFGDAIFRLTSLAFALSVLVLTTLFGTVLWIDSAKARAAFGWPFLWTSTWDPVALRFGALPFIYGTLATSAIALAIAVPLGLAAAICMAELLPRWLADKLVFLIELLVAVPSVVYGVVGVFVLVPIMRHAGITLQAVLGGIPLFGGPVYGVGLLTAGVLLAVMIVPFIISISREVLLAVPQSQRDAALALGATRWETVRQVVLPYARSGILGSVFLALARALGETMAVTMVIGNRPQIVASLFAPAYTMAAVLANEFSEATDDVYLAALVQIGFVLFVVTLVVNGLARLLIASVATPKAARA